MRHLSLMLVVMLLAPQAQAGFSWDLRVGVKGALTGNLWSDPDDKLPGSGPIWGDSQFFVGGGGGAFFEANLFGYLAVEADLLFEANSLKYNETINGFEYDYYTRFQQIRIPLLVKGVLPLDGLELSLGLGPEFVLGVGAGVDIDYRTKLTETQKQQADAILKPLYKTEKTGGTFLDTELGVTIKVWKLVIPISLRVGFNLSQSDKFDDRVDVTTSGATVTGAKVKAIESYNFALFAGVGYVF
jgi:hypothetical protein